MRRLGIGDWFGEEIGADLMGLGLRRWGTGLVEGLGLRVVWWRDRGLGLGMFWFGEGAVIGFSGTESVWRGTGETNWSGTETGLERGIIW